MDNPAKSGARLAFLDKPAASSGQDDGLIGDGLIAHGRLNLDVLVRLRWFSLGGELVLFGLAFALRLHLQYLACLLVIAGTAAFNLAVSLSVRALGPSRDSQLVVQLGFNIVQVSALLMLTGGIVNPFALMLIAPVTMAASILDEKKALVLALMAAAMAVVMTFWAAPLPWPTDPPPATPVLLKGVMLLAVLSGMGLTAFYAWRAAAEAKRMELALNVTHKVLAREQRLSALGGLAAAAAHELGTPLATISIVAKEMVREAPNDSVRDDAELLVGQAERCREILTRLTEEPDTTDQAVHARMTLLQFLNEVIERHLDTEIRVEAVVAGPPGARPPEIRRMPEVLHAMTSFVENAVDFAKSEVLVSVRFDERSIGVEVRDDGPGFSPDVLAQLGQPYITSRPNAEGSRSGHMGMGLGFFIAKTLLERTGAVVQHFNGRRGGAVIAARWAREAIEAPPVPGGFELGGPALGES
ncbi:ActS/PrrB/RegB family redox-sensitive histidine kinase [Phenylobacterium montanum]|uniref:histidine kinase n=1 Tax=Phenylobacterium montanum TaxID=2823693 RepID=A0A975IV20_9CAUL|nr:ActS/PrrB/RegB family redox-sensitive histidine kinase [Caulobacter sp. S6]QUD86851.1 ActS/PrrB/RegB family redox-sensitive histidine kinase [Caulobacter sp. S6]